MTTSFYDDFRQIIRDIAGDMQASDALMLNISSGTPAMKSALLVLATLGEYACRLMQVETPARKMNEHRHEGYDVELLWDGNEDNEENYENRCHEVFCPSLSQIKQEEMIKKLIRVYDYTAAREVASSLPPESAQSYLPLIELACARLQLDFPKLNTLEKEVGSDCIPMKSGDKQKYFEYALNMDIKRRKGEYTDFVRAITPLIVDLFMLILKNECNIDIKECFVDHPPKWDEAKLKKIYPEVDQVLHASFYSGFRYGFVYSSALVKVIREFSGNAKLNDLVEKLRGVEEKVRNRAAHEIVSLSDGGIKNMTGLNTEEIMKLLKEAFKYTGIGVSQKHWDSYDAMNETMIAAMP